MKTPIDEASRSYWARTVDKIVRGDRLPGFVRLGPTPILLRQYGLGPGDLVMSAGKIALARRTHPEVALGTWHNLPELLASPQAIFPSDKRDGSIIVATVAFDSDGHPIIAPILWDADQKRNVILSVYGRSGTERLNAAQWLDAQIQSARADQLPVYEKIGLADAEPKPDPVSTETTSWSPGMIPADRPARPKKDILSLRPKIKGSDGA